MSESPARSRLSPAGRAKPSKAAVLMDAGAMFFAVRDLHENAQLNYAALGEIIRRHLSASGPSTDVEWIMWSSVVPQNTGQVRFLEFAEQKLGWNVRRFAPSEGYMIDPASTPGLTTDARGLNRLLRFDASMAYAMGRMGADHRLVVISDSFAIAEPLVRAARTADCRNSVVFFGRLLDGRWLRLLRIRDLPVEHVDLDEFEQELFGAGHSKHPSVWSDDFLTR